MEKIHLVTKWFFDRVVLQYPKIVVFCMLAATIFLGFEGRKFRLDASSETLVLENDEDLRYSRSISRQYGQQDFLMLTYSPQGDIFSEKNLALLAQLQDDLASLEGISSVLSILDVPLLESSGMSVKELTSGLPTLSSPGIDKEQAKIELSESPLYRGLLLSWDSKTAALLISLRADDNGYSDLLGLRSSLRDKEASGVITKAERTELRQVTEQLRLQRDKGRKQKHNDIAAIRKIMDKYRSGADLFLGGVSMIADDMIMFIKNDLKVFGIGVVVLLAISLIMIFRRKRWVFIPMVCCMVSTIYMIGLLGWLGWEVTVVSSNFISLQLILTMSIVIHLIVRYREFLESNADGDNRQLILDTVLLKIKPCVYAVLTTITGFWSLVLCDMLPVINFGWMMIVGLIVSLLVTFLLFPAVLILLPKERLPEKRKSRFSLTSILAKFTETRGTLIVGFSVFILLFSIVGMSKLQVENCFIDYFGEKTEIYQGMKLIDQSLGGTTPLDVIVNFDQAKEELSVKNSAKTENDEIFDEFDEFDNDARDAKYWFTPEKVARIKAVHHYLENLTETGKVLSLASLLEVAEKLNKGKPLDSFELALLYSETPPELKNLLVKPYVSTERNEVRFWVRVRDSEESLRRNELLKKIRTDLTDPAKPGNGTVHLTGMLVLYNNMLQSLFSSQLLTLGTTVLILTGMFLVLFRSFKISVIAMLPNLLPIAVVLGVMGWLNVPLNMMTITIAAIGLGISVDDTIHYIHRFKDEFEKDRKYMATMHRCHSSIGFAMYYTSATIILGFSILALSNFVPSVYFGLLTGLAMLIAILAALTLLPELLILLKPFGKEA